VTHTRYARQLIAPGFQQAALERRLVCLSPGRLDPALHHLALVAGAMGVTQQTLAQPAPRDISLETPARLLRLNPGVALELVSLDLGLALCAPEETEGPYVVADVTTTTRTFTTSVRRLGKRAPDRVRFFARGRDSIVIGRSLREVRARAGRAPGVSPAIAAPLGLHGVEAAGHLLGDYLAAARAYDEPPFDEPMPRAPELLEIRPVAAISGPARPLTVLLVGGGGALAHAFLEALLHEPMLARSLRRLVVVDPDAVELSNLSRQILYAGAQLGEPKAAATARAFAARRVTDPGAPPPEVVAVPSRFVAEHLERFRPDVVGLFPDAFEPRAAAFAHLKRGAPGVLVLDGGTEFTYGTFRSVVIGAGAPCLDCGPEELDRSAAAERRERAGRAGCSQEHTPSNVLTNLFAGLLAARALASFLASGAVPPAQDVVNWMLPGRLHRGPELPACGCWAAARRSA